MVFFCLTSFSWYILIYFFLVVKLLLLYNLVFVDGPDAAGKTEFCEACADIFFVVNKKIFDAIRPVRDGEFKKEYTTLPLLHTIYNFLYPVKYADNTTKVRNFIENTAYTIQGNFSSAQARDFWKNPDLEKYASVRGEEIKLQPVLWYIFDRSIMSILTYYIMEREDIKKTEDVQKSIHPKLILRTFLDILCAQQTIEKIFFMEFSVSHATMMERMLGRWELSNHDRRMFDDKDYRERYFASMQKAYTYLEEVIQKSTTLQEKVSVMHVDNNEKSTSRKSRIQSILLAQIPRKKVIKKRNVFEDSYI